MQSAKKQPGPRKTGPGKGGNYEYLYKKGRHVPAGARLCGTDAVSGPAAENPSDTLRDHDCKKSTHVIEGYTYTDLNGGHEYFGLRVRGDSMDAAGIKDGYVVIVRRQDIVDNGQIAVCLIDGEEATLKRFSQLGNTVTLMPQSTNPDHRPFIFDITKTHVDILGLVVEVKFNPN